MSLLNYRQKIIKIADSSDLGWRVVQEYEANPLEDDSDDEKKLFKAEARAERKVKAEKSKKTKRTHPYVTPATGTTLHPRSEESAILIIFCL
jgi:hypothetical protein